MKKLIPILLIVLCLVLLVGCLDPIYLRTSEHVDRSDADGKDVRSLAGGANSKAPLRIGQITRAKVLTLLGPPTYESFDGHAIGYSSKICEGIWIYPACFTATPNTLSVYVLRLDFNEQGILQKYAVGGDTEDAHGLSWGASYEPYDTEEALTKALADVNASGAKLLPVRRGPVQAATQP